MEDLAQSLRNGRLRSELERAKAKTNFIYLLQTGLAVPNQHLELDVSGQWQYTAFWAALLALLHGLQVGGPIVGASRTDTVANLLVLQQQTYRATLGPGRPILPKWRSTIPFDQTESYARALPGIGWERAKVLVSIAPTWAILTKLCTSSGPRSIPPKLPGFGKVLWERLWRRVMMAV